MKNEIMIVADYTDESELTVTELCEICRIDAIVLQDLVNYRIIIPHGSNIHEWSFDRNQLKQLQKALRLQRDLELNYAGIALVLQLLAELDELRSIANIYHKHILK